MKKIAIIGNGWVGKAMATVFPNAAVYDEPQSYYTWTYDRDKRMTGGNKTNARHEVNECDVAFICVPTPNLLDGSLDASIIEEVLEWCKCPLIVIRSTMQPGTNRRLSFKFPDKHLLVQPEYLGETVAHPLLDESNRPFLIIGGDPVDRRQLIELYQGVYNANITIRQVAGYEAEVIKLSENRAIAFKVAQCQELYDVCEAAGVDYYTIRDAVYGDDPRFNLWFSFVFPDNRGMNSKCIPKDVLAWAAWAESAGYEPKITRMMLEKNQEWISA